MLPLKLRAKRAPFVKLGLAALAVIAAQCTLSSSLLAAPGDLYVTDLSTGSVVIYAPDGTASPFATGLTSPQGIAFDQSKNLYVVDAGDGATGNGVIFKYDTLGVRSTFFPPAGQPGLDNPVGLALDGGGLLVAEQLSDRVRRIPLDGGMPIVFQVITGPFDVASHGANLGTGFFRYISNGPIVREIAPDTTVTDLNFSTDPARGVVVDMSGNLFVSTDTGKVIEVAMGTTTQTDFSTGFTLPTGMDFRPAKFSGDTDRVGFLYVADTTTGEISQISSTGTKSTFVTAGNPNFIAFETNAPTPTPTPTPTATPTPTPTPTATPTPTPTPTATPTPSPTATPTPTPTATPTPTPSGTPAGRAKNISTRVDVETGVNVAIGGFIINGTGAKQVVIRGIGPSLTAFGVNGALPNPKLELRDADGTVITSNNDWQTNSAANQRILTDNGLAPSNDLEAAIVRTLEPGLYTAIASGNGGTTGIGLVEVYDLDDSTVDSELANISTRGLVGTDEKVMIGGVIIGPEVSTNATVLVRAIGPSLSDLGVTGALADPFLELRNADGDVITSNDNWVNSPKMGEIEDTGLAPSDDSESAILATLPAGAYTAIVSGKNSTTGVGLVEIYHITN